MLKLHMKERITGFYMHPTSLQNSQWLLRGTGSKITKKQLCGRKPVVDFLKKGDFHQEVGSLLHSE
jgi:hypothetical protein